MAATLRTPYATLDAEDRDMFQAALQQNELASQYHAHAIAINEMFKDANDGIGLELATRASERAALQTAEAQDATTDCFRANADSPIIDAVDGAAASASEAQDGLANPADAIAHHTDARNAHDEAVRMITEMLRFT